MMKEKKWLISYLTLASFFGDTLAQSSTASFAFPIKPTGTVKALTIDVVDTVVLEWTSNFQDAWLWLFCDTGTPGSPSVKKWGSSKKVDSSGNYVYSADSDDIDKNRDWTRAYECHFDLNYADEYRKAVNGPIFSISSLSDHKATTYARQATVTSLSPSTTPATSPKATPTTTPGTTPNVTPNATPNTLTVTTPDSTPSTIAPASTATFAPGTANASNNTTSGSSRLSSGAIAGIAIGAVIGVVAILVLGFLLWRNKRRANNLQTRGPTDQGDTYIKPQGVEAAPAYQLQADPPYKGVQMATMHVGPYQAPQELPASNTEYKR